MASVCLQGRYLQVKVYDIKQVSDSSPTRLTQSKSFEYGKGFWVGRWARAKEIPPGQLDC